MKETKKPGIRERPVQPLGLSDTQRKILASLVRRPSIAQSTARRAHVILAAAEGLSNGTIARRLGVFREMVGVWRRRWKMASQELLEVEATEGEKALTERIERVLADNARPGRPVTYRDEQVARIIALACEEPPQSGRPVSHWTPREVADEAVQRGIVGRISVRQVGRFLKRRRR